MLSQVVISDPKNRTEKKERFFPYKAASVTWLILSGFQFEEGVWINPITCCIAIISKGEQDETEI